MGGWEGWRGTSDGFGEREAVIVVTLFNEFKGGAVHTGFHCEGGGGDDHQNESREPLYPAE